MGENFHRELHRKITIRKNVVLLSSRIWRFLMGLLFFFNSFDVRSFQLADRMHISDTVRAYLPTECGNIARRNERVPAGTRAVLPMMIAFLFFQFKYPLGRITSIDSSHNNDNIDEQQGKSLQSFDHGDVMRK